MKKVGFKLSLNLNPFLKFKKDGLRPKPFINEKEVKK